ncbi:MAG: PDZ domain-containing protein [Gammaproteobacteria bacterium AqS3]|nr:PDZ domain-containing protein [Gammaproteobacteria bacterium AqS3]
MQEQPRPAEDMLESGEAPAEDTPIPPEELAAFGKIYRLILRHHPDTSITPEQLIEGAIRGMLSSVDNYSEYISAGDVVEREKKEQFGQVQDVGIEIARTAKGIQVLSVYPNSPAHKGGVKALDVLLEIDGSRTALLGMNTVRAKLAGETGTKARLTVLREGAERRLEFERSRYEFTEVENLPAIEGGYGHIRIHWFSADTADRFELALSGLLRLEADGINGLLIDLRGNAGGHIESALKSAQKFIDGHSMISIRMRPPAQPIRYRAARGDVLSGIPIVLLVDGGTASAAEMFTLALQQNNRAVVVGNQTFGKGSTQSSIAIGADRELILTTGYYLDPLGKSIHARGIKPDVLLGLRPPDQRGEEDWQVERALDVLRALDRMRTPTPPPPAQSAESSSPSQEDNVAGDIQELLRSY